MKKIKDLCVQLFTHIFNGKSWIYILQLIFGVIFSIISLKVFNVYEKGELLYLETVSSLIIGVFSFGFYSYIPIYFDKLNFNFNVYRKLVGYISIIVIVGLITWIILLKGSEMLFKHYKIFCFVAYLAVVYLKSLNDTILQIINNTKILASYILIPSIINLFIVAIIFFNFHPNYFSPLYFFIVVNILAQFFTNIIAFIFLKNYKYNYLGDSFYNYFSGSIKLYPSNLFSIVSKKLDVLVLAKLGPNSLGNYGVIVSIREVVMVFFRVRLLDDIAEIKKNKSSWFFYIKHIFPLTLVLTFFSILVVVGFDLISNDSYIRMKSIVLSIVFYIFSYLLYCILMNFLQAKMGVKILFIVNLLFVFLQFILMLIKFDLLTFLFINSVFYCLIFLLFTFYQLFNYRKLV